MPKRKQKTQEVTSRANTHLVGFEHLEFVIEIFEEVDGWLLQQHRSRFL